MSDSALIQALQNPACYHHPLTGPEVIETHISWVILTGDYAYKIKKPVNLGFLDFSSLEQRHHYCQQELELNRRLAPQIYLEVVAITGSPEAPVIDGEGEAIEYAVKMRQFPQSAQLDKVLARDELTSTHIDQLADTTAAFHQRIQVAGLASPFGTPEAILNPVEENFHQIRPFIKSQDDLARLQRLESWSRQSHQQLKTVITQRKADGFVRNCHGDMHLANIALLNDEIIIFDCIEFNDSFRWIDVISEIAFTTMDLIDRGHADFATRFIDRYLQRTGDYAGLALLQFYQVYRALVRAKVAAIRGNQPGLSEQEQNECLQQYRDYAALAESFTASQKPILFIAHGVSGSGKTTLTQPLLEQFGMIRLRSDVERKRLFGLEAEARTEAIAGGGIYNKDASQRTYEHLADMAQHTCEAGYSTIVDATFLKQAQRHQFKQLAIRLDIKFVILHFHADEALLQKWIKERSQAGKDASEATIDVLRQQLATEEPLEANEADQIISIDSGDDSAVTTLINAVKSLSYEQNIF